MVVVVGRGYGAGYWSPATATIDWCERNYEVTNHTFFSRRKNSVGNAIMWKCASHPHGFFFQVTQYVAEYWNTISNAILCVGALCGLYQVRKHKLETRFEYPIFYREALSTVQLHISRIATCYLSLLLIGVGSTLFHATLKYEMQLLDELPMIWGIASYIYVLWQVRRMMRCRASAGGWKAEK